MKKALALLVLASTACAYHSPTQPSPPPPDLTSPATLQVTAAPGAGRATITAVVSNRVGAPLASVAVTFGTDAGRITPETATTNAQGVATAGVLAPAGAARITATAGTITTAALVAIQPVSPGTQAAPDVPTPEPTPLPVPPPTGQPLTVAIVGTAGQAGTPTTFGLAISEPVKTAVWDFGDTSALVTTTTATTSHVYAAGTYTASVIVTDDLSRTASAQTTLVIAPQPTTPPPPPSSPTVTLNCSTGAHVLPPVATTCVAAATVNGAAVPGSSITSVVWDFGDGTPTVTTPNNASGPHQYLSPNTFTIFGTATITGVTGTVAGSTTTTVAP